jgi:hypothetical protein
MYKNKEDYNEYFRNYYHSHKQLKYDDLKNNMRLLSNEIIKQNNVELNDMLKNVYDSLNGVIPQKQKFCIPKELADFTTDEISNPLQNLK